MPLMNINRIRCYTLILITLIATGCSTAPMQPSELNSGPAAQLISQADMMQQMGDYNNAIALVERAVRIDPRNAYAWHRLANLNLLNSKLDKAEQFALRSNQFAAGNKELLEANQNIINEVNRLRGKGTK